MSPRDLVAESFAGLFARPARVALTVLGTVIGVAALVATLGLSKTASNQIVGRFDELAATDIVVTPRAAPAARASTVLPWDAEARLQRLNGVVAAGTLSDVDVRGELVRSVPDQRPARGRRDPAPGQGRVARRCAAAVRARAGGGPASSTPATRGARDRVVVLGPNAARRSASTRVDQQPAIFIGDRLYLVIGILAGRRAPAVAARRGDHARGHGPARVRAARRRRSRRSRPASAPST